MVKPGGTERVNPDEPKQDFFPYTTPRPAGESPPTKATGYQRDAMPMVEFEIKRTGDMFWINVDGVCWLRAKLAPGCAVMFESDRALDRIELA